ncbi:MAG TPA: zinc-ribbon domain-containing protein, partial [Burkholderiales bacterium]
MLREDQFCPQCGKSMNTSSTCCESCGYPAPVGARFCIKCGARIGSAPVVPDTGSAALRQTEPSAQVIALKPDTPVAVLTSNTIQS